MYICRMKISKQKIIIAVFIVVGSVAGYFYWKLIGCNSGTCPITSKWHWTTLYGAFFGYVIADTINAYIKRREKAQQKD